ncbi:MAG: dihydroorotate dehydrogenase electron transfer subunit [Syntrophobacterales bacterium]|nr:dihydroorotate dehydrogenase electron transfer subunit [Syntrophobacterales bacterium]
MEHKKSIISGEVVTNHEVTEDHFLMSLTVPDNFKAALPGQFIMVRVKDMGNTFLARPFSIYSTYSVKNNTVLEVLYRVVGKGTLKFSCLKRGDKLDILGPLGNGFDMPPDCKKITLVAGGIGVAPLSFLAEYYGQRSTDSTDDRKVICYIGARTSEWLVGVEKLEEVCSRVIISTDDGSQGHHGYVTDLFRKDINLYRRDGSMVYSCGPYPMMKKIAGILEDYPIPCQVSIEERMACGVGACLGCAVRVKSRVGHSRYMRVCTDGPVFDIEQIIWD